MQALRVLDEARSLRPLLLHVMESLERDALAVFLLDLADELTKHLLETEESSDRDLTRVTEGAILHVKGEL